MSYMAMLPIKTVVVYCIWALLSGSIPFGFFVIKIAGMGDVRNYGSGNIGATNVMRTGGKMLGATTLLLDTTKGFLPIFLAHHIGNLEPELLTVVILFAVVGHMFTPWLNFNGGKGVSTAMGAILAYHPIMLVPAIIAFFLTVAVLKYVSLGSIVASLVLFTTAIGLLGKWAVPQSQGCFPFWLPLFSWATLVTMIIIKHTANMKRIFYGTESKYQNVKQKITL